ncbi:hypothetical protein GCM10009734_31390 [Nonomuraea bangladeshensis]
MAIPAPPRQEQNAQVSPAAQPRLSLVRVEELLAPDHRAGPAGGGGADHGPEATQPQALPWQGACQYRGHPRGPNLTGRVNQRFTGHPYLDGP